MYTKVLSERKNLHTLDEALLFQNYQIVDFYDVGSQSDLYRYCNVCSCISSKCGHDLLRIAQVSNVYKFSENTEWGSRFKRLYEPLVRLKFK